MVDLASPEQSINLRQPFHLCTQTSGYKMVYHSYFDTFWPLLKLLQAMGMFPIRKASESLCGFEAISVKRYLPVCILYF